MQIFLSFDFQKDIDKVNGFRSILENPNSDISFIDGSCKKDYAGKSENIIKQQISQLLDKASVTVCLISKYTKKSQWVKWELEASRSKSKGIVGIVLKDKNHEIKSYSDCPSIFDNKKYFVYYWNNPVKLKEHIQKAEKNR
jgi:hypothetical protein